MHSPFLETCTKSTRNALDSGDIRIWNEIISVEQPSSNCVIVIVMICNQTSKFVFYLIFAWAFRVKSSYKLSYRFHIDVM